MLEPGHEEKRLSVRRVDPSEDEEDALHMSAPQQDLNNSNQHLGTGLDEVPSALHLSTQGLTAPPAGRPLSSTTTFEESPILGIPGSFMTTPPMAQNTPPMNNSLGLPTEQETPALLEPQPVGELLQALTFQPTNKRLNEMTQA